MSEASKPIIYEEKSARIKDIISETEKQFSQQEKPTPAETKRFELIKKMKQDPDKQEYMIMFNVLMISLSLISLVHFAVYGKMISLVCIVFCLIYFVWIRRRLTSATLQLVEYKNNFDKYLWEGFYLKEMRHSAVKLAYFVFFPFLVVFVMDLIRGDVHYISLWLSLATAVVISTIGWWLFFKDDANTLRSIESDLKSLAYI